MSGQQSPKRKPGRPKSSETLADLAMANGMRPAHGHDGREGKAAMASSLGSAICSAYNTCFQRNDHLVVTALIGAYCLISDGARRLDQTPAPQRTSPEKYRRYIPNGAPALPPHAVALMGFALTSAQTVRSNEGSWTATVNWQSHTDPFKTVIGEEGGKPVYARKRATWDMEAGAFLAMGSAYAWMPGAGVGHPEPDSARRRLSQLGTTPFPGLGFAPYTQAEGIAVFGEAVGTCPDAERLALDVLIYGESRHGAGGDHSQPTLRMCRGTACLAPLFLWAQLESDRPHDYCRLCLPGSSRDGGTAAERARGKHRQQRHRRRPKDP